MGFVDTSFIALCYWNTAAAQEGVCAAAMPDWSAHRCCDHSVSLGVQWVTARGFVGCVLRLLCRVCSVLSAMCFRNSRIGLCRRGLLG